VKLLDLTLPTPAENLACDEALLDLCELGGDETLRFWESSEPFVVVGYGNRVEMEVNVGECTRRDIPILRRCSGGGTVVQGPGCLNYNLTLRIDEGGPLATVTGTNQFVMERNRAALEKLLGVRVSVQGHTDLAFAADVDQPSTLNSQLTWLKFSGNAQRRRRCALVFHGTILHHFDLGLLDALLRFPSAQPAYRENRQHTAFVRNIPASAEMIREALRSAWNAKACAEEIPHDHIAKLVDEHYAHRDWNFRR
jgi:lipoate-protein ligase A